MNKRLSLLATIALMLPLPWVTRADDGTKSPPVIGPGRQVISQKLARIRVDSVSYDGLPLPEVVRNLRDESRRRDPEKKGINFMVNPNGVPSHAVAGTPGAEPPEYRDPSQVQIRILPPLTDVRLVDVLDAVVKVADFPIKYAIEDYGVVFSLQAPESARREWSGFTFPGGTPNEFLDAVQKQCKVDWVSVADIPKEMADARIPRLRIHKDSLARENDPLSALVALYNELGQQKPELGRLVVKGDLIRPSVVMFVPDKAAADARPKIKVKAFSIYGITDADRENLEKDIDSARSEAMQYTDHLRDFSGMRSLEGTVAIHKDTSLLVATGPEPFVEMVESIVTACQAKAQARKLPPPGAPGR